ncbi:hypothetical protein BI364_16645 [Acidihalobacter yilgarnensis]|uniref:Diguanylate cyclase n=1 Tax=Acidihalobacter yilgarnensis TaxID=2819280 RepID=A0A1D8IS67_9GAMM|nr:EAL domain-containing protein [Acidihalobacter yilgarnensis]AOU99341.1 hypothetical protein BI364_16645 [Acidihalobacter yilgarnensis]
MDDAHDSARATINARDLLDAYGGEAAFVVDTDDPRQPIVDCNAALCRLYGYTRDTLCGNSWLALHLGPTDGEAQHRLVDQGRAAVTDRSPCVLTLTGYRHDGQTLRAHLRLIKLDYPDEAGGSRYMGGIETDVTALYRAHRIVDDQRRLLTTRSAIQHLIARRPSPEHLFQATCETLMRRMPELLAWISTPDSERTRLLATAGPEHPPAPVAVDGVPFGTAQSGHPVGDCFTSGHAHQVHDLMNHPAMDGCRDWAQRADMRAMLALPIRHANHGGGVLSLFAQEPGYFNDELIRCCEGIGEALELGLQALERDRELRLTRDFYAALSEINQLITRHPEPEALFKGICNLIFAHASMDAIWIGLLEPDQRIRVVASAIAPDIDFDPYALDLSADTDRPNGQGSAGCAIRTGHMQVVEDLVQAVGFKHWHDVHRRSNLRAVAAFPFTRRGATIGVVSVSSRRPGLFSAPLVDLLQRLSHNISFGLDDYDRDRDLEYLALHDPLTGLHNRSAFQDRLRLALDESGRQPNPSAVALLDLDTFKEVNDQHGHNAGDHLLIEIAQRLKPAVRAGDTVARLGGDEFGVLLPHVQDADTLRTVLERILTEVARPIVLPDGSRHTIGVSIGVVIANHGMSLEDLLKRADYALYRVKNRGGQGYAFFDQTLEAEVNSRNRVRRDFVRALDEHAVILHYQPQMDLERNCIHGAEVLVRWQDGDELLHPASFIDEVESDTGLACELGHNVLERAATQIDDWLAAGEDYRLSVNIGLKHLSSSRFPDDIERVITRHPQAIGRLNIEITERAALHSPERARQHLEWAASRGIAAHLDDFGTAYASLEWLQTLPIAGIKLDVKFVRGILQDSHNLAIATSMSVLASLEGLQLVAEGIENRAERDILLDLGITLGQGYFFSPALPAGDFTDWARAYSSEHEALDPRRAPFQDYLGLQVLLSQIAAAVHLFELALEPRRPPPVLEYLLKPAKLPLYRWLERHASSCGHQIGFTRIQTAFERLHEHALQTLQVWRHDPTALSPAHIDTLQTLLAELREYACCFLLTCNGSPSSGND